MDRSNDDKVTRLHVRGLTFPQVHMCVQQHVKMFIHPYNHKQQCLQPAYINLQPDKHIV